MNTETLFDLRDNFVDFCKYGAWWQRLGGLLALGLFAYFLFWIRPVPNQIKERTKYMQDSIGVLFADGASRFYHDTYSLTLPNGNTETWSRERFKQRLVEQFEGHKERREKPHRSTVLVKARWTGWKKLVQTVHMRGTLYGRDGVLADNLNEIDLTWEKKHNGWMITRMHIKGPPTSP